MKSFPDAADQDGLSGIFVSQASNDDDSIKSTVKEFDERRKNTIDAEVTDNKLADNTSLSDQTEECAEDEWSCHIKGEQIFWAINIRWNSSICHGFLIILLLSSLE